MSSDLRMRQKSGQTATTKGEDLKEELPHPGGEIKHSVTTQVLRLLLLVVYFFTSCCWIVTTQFLGVPLYWIDKKFYYSYMAMTKQSFGIISTTLTQWWAPTPVRVSWDSSVAGQLKKTPDGRLECHFPDRIVMIANHQLYSDWLYMWWVAYTNQPRMHGHIYIILKESLKNVPIIGWGMQFYGFIFMSRKMSVDQPRLAYRLEQLSQVYTGPFSGRNGLDPMWLLLFPEGTNLSANTRKKSVAWAEKAGLKDFEQVLLPRSTGSFFCLNELKGTVDYVYDCTLAYGGVPRGQYGQDLYTLRSIYLQGRPPRSVNMYWRRFAIADIPLDDHDIFDLWLRQRWQEKDDLMNGFLDTGRFPPSKSVANGLTNGASKGEYIDTEVKLAHWWEVGNIFVVLGTYGLLANLAMKLWGAMWS